VEHVDVNGIRIAYSGAGSGASIVMVHGAPADSRTWQWMLPYLSRDHTVIAWDAPGFGQSSDIDDTWRAAQFADALAAFVGHDDAREHPSRDRSSGGLNRGGVRPPSGAAHRRRTDTRPARRGRRSVAPHQRRNAPCGDLDITARCAPKARPCLYGGGSRGVRDSYPPVRQERALRVRARLDATPRLGTPRSPLAHRTPRQNPRRLASAYSASIRSCSAGTQ
jgi:hypothetical protein